MPPREETGGKKAREEGLAGERKQQEKMDHRGKEASRGTPRSQGAVLFWKDREASIGFMAERELALWPASVFGKEQDRSQMALS